MSRATFYHMMIASRVDSSPASLLAATTEGHVGLPAVSSKVVLQDLCGLESRDPKVVMSGCRERSLLKDLIHQRYDGWILVKYNTYLM